MHTHTFGLRDSQPENLFFAVRQNSIKLTSFRRVLSEMYNIFHCNSKLFSRDAENIPFFLNQNKTIFLRSLDFGPIGLKLKNLRKII